MVLYQLDEIITRYSNLFFVHSNALVAWLTLKITRARVPCYVIDLEKKVFLFPVVVLLLSGPRLVPHIL